LIKRATSLASENIDSVASYVTGVGGVAGFGARGYETTRKYFKGDTQK